MSAHDGFDGPQRRDGYGWRAHRERPVGIDMLTLAAAGRPVDDFVLVAIPSSSPIGLRGMAHNPEVFDERQCSNGNPIRIAGLRCAAMPANATAPIPTRRPEAREDETTRRLARPPSFAHPVPSHASANPRAG